MKARKPRQPRIDAETGKASTNTVHFTGSKSVKDLPDNVVIIPISGNGIDYTLNTFLYKRFKAVMHIKVGSAQLRDSDPHPDITLELVKAIVEFSEQHKGIPLVFHCSAGEQRSVAFASALEIYDYRLPHFFNPIEGANSDQNFMDRCIWWSTRRFLNVIREEVENAASTTDDAQ